MKMEDINFSQIHNELEYVKNELKTRNGLLVGGLRISDFSNATNEMMQVKKFFGKLDGRIALHGLISLDQEESTQKSAGNESGCLCGSYQYRKHASSFYCKYSGC